MKNIIWEDRGGESTDGNYIYTEDFITWDLGECA